ncbi:MAG: hypothetical protein AAB515_04230 [Patescibacteria group bacterium]
MSNVLNQLTDDDQIVRGVLKRLKGDLEKILQLETPINATRINDGQVQVTFKLPDANEVALPSGEGSSCTLIFGEVPGSAKLSGTSWSGLWLVQLTITDPYVIA